MQNVLDKKSIVVSRWCERHDWYSMWKRCGPNWVRQHLVQGVFQKGLHQVSDLFGRGHHSGEMYPFVLTVDMLKGPCERLRHEKVAGSSAQAFLDIRRDCVWVVLGAIDVIELNCVFSRIRTDFDL